MLLVGGSCLILRGRGDLGKLLRARALRARGSRTTSREVLNALSNSLLFLRPIAYRGSG